MIIPIETGNIFLDILANGGAGVIIAIVIGVYVSKKDKKKKTIGDL